MPVAIDIEEVSRGGPPALIEAGDQFLHGKESMERGAPGFRSAGAAQQEQRRPAVESDEDIAKTILIHIGDAANAGVFRDGIEVLPNSSLKGA